MTRINDDIERAIYGDGPPREEPPLRTFKFYVRRSYSAKIEALDIEAHDSFEAVSLLPDDLVYWDFVGGLGRQM